MALLIMIGVGLAHNRDGQTRRREAMFMILYSLLLSLGLLVSAPVWLWRMARNGRYRDGLRERLGFVPEDLRAAVAGKKTIWVHAVSVGEIRAIERLIADLKAALPGYVVAISTTTATGQKIARERFGGSPVFYFPLDFAFAVRAWMRVLRPRLVVLVESEFWPRHLVECEYAGVPVAVVNARISDRSFPRYMRLRWLWKPLLAKISLFLAQGQETAERLGEIGAAAGRVRVSGNLKYDAPTPESRIAHGIGLAISDRKVVVAGSTASGEEETLLECWQAVLAVDPNVLLILAPRHPQRFAEVADMIGEHHFWYTGASILKLAEGDRLDGVQVLLLDTVGDLAATYALADVAFVGGSLVPRGGQNPLEAARFGVPVVMGPSFENFREIVELMRVTDAIRIVEPARLGAALIELLKDDDGMGERGRRFFETQSGATGRTVEALLELIRA